MAKKTSDSDQPEDKQDTGKKSAAKKTATPAKESQSILPEGDAIIGMKCPLCGKGTILKGKTAYGCSEWKNGCTFRKPF